MNDEGPDVNRIHSAIVNTVIVAGIIGLAVIVLFALNQKQEPTEYGCVYDPRDGSKYCQQAP